MQLTEYYAYEYYLKSANAEIVALSPKGKVSLVKGHKVVLAVAAIASFDEHSPSPASTGNGDLYYAMLPGTATVLFESFTQNGQVKSAGGPLVMGENITEVIWNFRVKHCWSRATVTILAFD